MTGPRRKPAASDPWREAASPPRSDLVPLRILTNLRWIAIAGQVGAIVAATRLLGLDVATGPASLAVGASVIVNLVAGVVAPRARRLSGREASLLLAFDILQLGLLLALTGGLNNPFAVLMLGPATIAATVLAPRPAWILSGVTLAAIAGLWLWHLPLGAPAGPLELPRLFLAGFWLALSIGVLFLGLYARRVTAEIAAVGEALAATQLALARAQRLADLDGVVAAAAHQLGTPLATIKLASAEMIDALARRPDLALDLPDLLEDARLVRSEVDRCRDILRDMGRAGRRDPYLDRAPIEAVLREAAEPHQGRGVSIEIVAAPGRQPMVPRRPEILHGLRNLIQNAVDFARTRVRVQVDWPPDDPTKDPAGGPEPDGRIEVRIGDDGPGFPPGALGRIGDPFLRGPPPGRPPTGRPREGPSGTTPEAAPGPNTGPDAGADPDGGGAAAPGLGGRAGYDGMGLGLFIAKTLLERTGARLTFANAPAGGAVVVVAWPLSALEAEAPTGPPTGFPIGPPNAPSDGADGAR